MTERLFSPYWHEVAELRPRLRDHVIIHRHSYRGRRWYVLEDRSRRRTLRFPAAAYGLLARMDGRRTVDEIWRTAVEELGEEAPTQDNFFQLLSQLEKAGALQCDVPPTSGNFVPTREPAGARWRRGASRILCLRIPFLDPDRLLERCLPAARAFFSRSAFMAWAAVACAAAALAAIHWTDLTAGFAGRARSGGGLVLLWIVFILSKALHEVGHAFAVKARGGEVHEMGISLLFLSPVPYVNASGASAFPDKRHRILVGAAGMMVEVFLASIALFLWLAIEPGSLRSLLEDVMLVTGLSTLLFNANPLVRLDGYYILCDALEIPNLQARSAAELRHLAERRLFGIADSAGPAATRAEAVFFTLYGASSAAYRLALLAAISICVGSRSLLLGLMIGAFCAVDNVVVPLFRAARHVAASPRLEGVRLRAIAACLFLMSSLAALTCILPFPLRTLAEGVVRPPEEGIVRPGADMFIEQVLRAPGSHVRRGDALFACADPLVAARVAVLESELAELHARRDEASQKDVVDSQMLGEEIIRREEKLEHEKALLDQLTIRSSSDGVFVVPRAEDLPGRFMKKGAPLGFVVPPHSISVHAVIPQDGIELVRHRTAQVEVRFPQMPDEIRQVSIVREVPAASKILPSPALGTPGGGRVAVSASDEHGATAAENVFQIELDVPWTSAQVPLGGRVWVRMHHGYEPLITRWWSGARRLFLRRLGV